MYIAAGEVKSSSDMAVSQNLEQMLGLWRASQVFMLGWTINPKDVYCHILVRRENKITLYNVKVQNADNDSILFLSNLYLAAILIEDN